MFNLGVFQSVGRLVSLSNDENQTREYYFSSIVITILLWILMNGIILLIMIFYKEWDNVKSLFICTIPFNICYLFIGLNELLLQGNNRIGMLSLARSLPRFLFLLILFLFLYCNCKFEIKSILSLYLVTYCITYAYIYKKLRPLPRNLIKRCLEIFNENKKSGFNIYMGSVFAVGMSNVSGIVINHFEKSVVSVGIYTLALQLSTPISLIPNILGTVSFRNFVHTHHISKRVTILLIIICLIMLGLIFAISHPLILLIYGEGYIDSIPLLEYLAIGAVLYGLADFYGKFLLAKGKGRELRNSAISVGISLLISNFFFVQFWGALGAAYAKICAGCIYLLVIYLYYRSLLKT